LALNIVVLIEGAEINENGEEDDDLKEKKITNKHHHQAEFEAEEEFVVTFPSIRTIKL